MKTPYILLVAFLLLVNIYQPKVILCQVKNTGKARGIFKSKQKVISKEDSVQVLNKKAIQFYNSGKLDSAIFFANLSLNLCRSIYKGDHPDLARSINNMANFYYERGNYKEAEPLLNETLEMFRRLFKGDHPTIVTTINNLAEYYNKQGNYKEVEPLYKEALEMSRRLFKDDHPVLAVSINNMGIFYYEVGNYKEAEPLLKEALEMRMRLFKGDHPDLANSLNNMAYFYNEIGNYKEAGPLYKKALSIYRKLYRGDHPDLALSINNMARFYFNHGIYNEAEYLFKEALEMYRRLFKSDHPDLAKSINSMAVFDNERGNYKDAEPLLKEALEMRMRLFKGDHPDLAISINNLAGFYKNRGNYTDAEILLKIALEMSRRLFNGDHPNLALSIYNIAYFYYERNNYSDAEPFFIEALNDYKKYFLNNVSFLSEKEIEQFWITVNYNFTFFNSFVTKYYKTKPEISCQAYDNCLFTKALLLNATKKVRERILNSGDKELIEKYNDWISKKEVLAKYYSLTKQEIENSGVKLDSLENVANELEKELSRRSELFAKEYEKKKVTWQDVQSMLKDNEAAIEIVRFNYYDKNWTDTVYYAALIVNKETKEHPELVLLKNGNELDSVYLGEYNTVIERQGEGSISPEESDKTMGELYEQFWKPIAEKLKGIKKVYLSLDGAYNQINLETLINPVTKQYLYEEIELHLLTSTRDLVLASMINKTQTM